MGLLWCSMAITERQDRLRSGARQSAIGRFLDRRKSVIRIDFGRCPRAAAPPTLDGRDRSPSPVRPARRPGGGRGAARAPLAARLGRRQLAVPARGRGRRLGAGGPGRPRAGWAPARLRCDRWRGALPRPLVAAALAVRPRAGLGADRGLLVLRGLCRPDRLVHRRRLPPLAAGVPGRRTAARDVSGLPRRAARRRRAPAAGVLRHPDAGLRRHRRVGHVQSAGAASRGASACAMPRPSRSCASSRSATPSARASRARCTTCWPTGSRC